MEKRGFWYLVGVLIKLFEGKRTAEAQQTSASTKEASWLSVEHQQLLLVYDNDDIPLLIGIVVFIMSSVREIITQRRGWRVFGESCSEWVGCVSVCVCDRVWRTCFPILSGLECLKSKEIVYILQSKNYSEWEYNFTPQIILTSNKNMAV